ncbi:MAG: NupC/NupG family nucleoside CNT transporter [Planctomycetota bacterium]|jgi:CNT family concentrative nucleoside transporter
MTRPTDPKGLNPRPRRSRKGWILPLAVLVVLFLFIAVAWGAEGKSAPEGEERVPLVYRLLSIGGLFAMVAVAWAFSANRRAISWRPVIWGIVLQCLFGLIVLSPTVGQFFFTVVDGGVKKLLSFSEKGADFVMMAVAPHHVVHLPGDKVNINLDAEALRSASEKAKVPPDLVDKVVAWNEKRGEELSPANAGLLDDMALTEGGFDPAERVIIHKVYYAGDERGFYYESVSGRISPILKTFTFWILPTIIFFSSLMTVLYHLGIMQWVVRAFAFVMEKTMGTSGAETLSASANIFVGQTEAPLVVKPYVEKMTVSELNAVMVGGFATVAGGVMAAYIGLLRHIPGIAGHLVTASIMSAPAALAIAKIMMPETGEPETGGGATIKDERPDANVIEAATRGATDGMRLTLNVVAMLVAIVGLVAMVNWILGTWWMLAGCLGLAVLLAGSRIMKDSSHRIWIRGGAIVLFLAGALIVTLAGVDLSLEGLLGGIFYPFAIAMGVPAGDEAMVVGKLLGEKIVLTEFIAYIHLAGAKAELSYRSAVIASYALCGFANFASIGIQIGGIGGIAPSRRADLAKIGLRAMIGGAIAACMTGTIAGIILP